MYDFRDQINQLTKGKATHLKLGKRSIPHRLTKEERLKFESSLEKGYLNFKFNFRENLKNSFTDYKISEGFEPIILEDNLEFPVNFKSIINRLYTINPEQYSSTRNYLSGKISKLSPYITRGVISLKQIWDYILKKYPNINKENQILKELAWREYFIRVRENLGDKIFNIELNNDLSSLEEDIPKAIIESKTGIKVLDDEILKLQNNGYIHNHSRMWIASLISNISKTSWKTGADWMYYYLIDGELSSNYLNWQWIAGTYNRKKYYANQDNINLFSESLQKNTILNYSYEELPKLNLPQSFQELTHLTFKNQINQIKSTDYSKDKKTLLYSSWNLDPNWHLNDTNFQRILLLEPSHFDTFPVSAKVLSFIIKLSREIKGLKLVIKDYKNLDIDPKLLITKSHLNTRYWYANIVEEQEYLFPNITTYYKSFSSYWKASLKTIM